MKVAFGYKKNNPARRAGEKNNLAPILSEKNILARTKNPSPPPPNIKWTVPYHDIRIWNGVSIWAEFEVSCLNFSCYKPSGWCESLFHLADVDCTFCFPIIKHCHSDTDHSDVRKLRTLQVFAKPSPPQCFVYCLHLAIWPIGITLSGFDSSVCSSSSQPFW